MQTSTDRFRLAINDFGFLPRLERTTDYDSYEDNLKSLLEFWEAFIVDSEYACPATETEVMKIIHTLYTELLAIQRARLRRHLANS
jgi:hypothetical protein